MNYFKVYLAVYDGPIKKGPSFVSVLFEKKYFQYFRYQIMAIQKNQM